MYKFINEPSKEHISEDYLRQNYGRCVAPPVQPLNEYGCKCLREGWKGTDCEYWQPIELTAEQRTKFFKK
jgi:hypothetical protein